jgi:Family of unknown function (DUF6092)
VYQVNLKDSFSATNRNVDAEKKGNSDPLRQFLFEYALFLMTSARGCVDEPPIYGPLRLMDAVSRLTEIYSRTDAIELDNFLLRIKKEIDVGKNKAMESNEEFVKLLDEIIVEFTDELKKRY